MNHKAVFTSPPRRAGRKKRQNSKQWMGRVPMKPAKAAISR